ncbi:Protein CBG05976 [Caenorhabditis briggsae]|uniref:Protein CBG05976 n=1 Tax=Caenorhabditis briggsae TaxID=6238 RepID=A8X171_CAEBR|nr:Protein CBG05976 [Caenorhabditis briggsae]CAP26381.2 Protein CBG05976 [Caenorhabditis briggsae]
MRALVFLSTLLGLSYSVISNRNSRRLCFYGWTQFEQDCYKAYKMRAQFMEAENKCNEVGAHLTSIHSVEENDFLREFTRTGNVQENKWDNNVWIGFFFEKQSGTWKWLDGSPTDYTNWATGEPNFMEYDSEGQASVEL